MVRFVVTPTGWAKGSRAGSRGRGWGNEGGWCQHTPHKRHDEVVVGRTWKPIGYWEEDMVSEREMVVMVGVQGSVSEMSETWTLYEPTDTSSSARELFAESRREDKRITEKDIVIGPREVHGLM